MNKKIIAFIALVLIVAAGAVGAFVVIENNKDKDSDDATTSEDSKKDNSDSNSVKAGKFSQDDIDEVDEAACEVLSTDMVVEIAGDSISESEISQSEIYGCNYSWDKENAEEIEASNDELINEAILNGKSIVEAAKGLPSSTATVSFYVDTFTSPDLEDAVERAYRTQINKLTDAEIKQNEELLDQIFDSVSEDAGLSDSSSEIGSGLLDTIIDEAKAEVYEDVSGISTQAAWSDTSNKLVVLHGNMIFTITLDVYEDDADNLDTAKDLAKQVIKNINDVI